MRKRLSATEQLQMLQASGLDYLLLAVACFVPLYRSGEALQMRVVGLGLGVACVLGLFVSLFVRRTVKSQKILKLALIPQLVLAILIAINIQTVNSWLPDGGFPWQLLNTAYLSFLLVACSMFIWSDGMMFFQLVPGIALFGILSWIETGNDFTFWLVAFMASVAVLLTRLHTRSMVAMAFAAGRTDIEELKRTSWRTMAGPTLAIISVVVIALLSHFLSPTVGDTISNALGNPEIRINLRPQAAGGAANVERVDNRIGLGPATASNMPLLRVRTDRRVNLIRRAQFLAYRGRGWLAPGAGDTVERAPTGEAPESGRPDVDVYSWEPQAVLLNAIPVITEIQSITRQHVNAPVPGYPIRVEYDGKIRTSRREIIVDDGIPRGKTLWVKSLITTPSPDELRAVESADKSERRNLIREFDNNTWHPEVIKLSDQIAETVDNQYDLVQAYMREIASRTRYNLQAERILGDEDRVKAFLFDTQEGYCDLFASALAVMLRTQGVEARMVTGYWLDPNSMEDGAYIVRDRHAHAWTEVYFEGYGFIPFDVTELAEAVPGGEVGSMLDDEGGGLGARLAWYLAAGLVGTLGLIYFIAQIIGWSKTVRRLSPILRKVRPGYRLFMRGMRPVVGRPRRPAETIREYVDAYRAASQNGEMAANLGRDLEAILYSPDERTEQQVDQFTRAVKQFAKECRTRGK